MTEKSQYEYDVAFSFAGAQRAYVEQVRNALKKYEVSVFYDYDNSVDLWGKNLYRHLDKLYSKRAHYCVMFISKEYSELPWTIHESQSAQERMFLEYNNSEFQEYILPVFFDDTQIPGIRCTTGYMDARKIGPEELAKKIAEKLGKGMTLISDSFNMSKFFEELLSLLDEQMKNKPSYQYKKEREFVQIIRKNINSMVLSLRLLEDCIILEFYKSISGYSPSLLLFFRPENTVKPLKAINFSNYFFQSPEQDFTPKEWLQLFNCNLLKILESENDTISGQV